MRSSPPSTAKTAIIPVSYTHLDVYKRQQQYDVIIAGAGVSGLFCALSLPKNCNILVLSKDRLDHSDSYLAQGGISVLLDASDYDTYFEDTLKAGHYENNREAVDIMIRTSREIIDDLIAYGCLLYTSRCV